MLGMIKRFFSKSESKTYNVWYRHSGEAQIDRIPNYTPTREMTVREIVDDISPHTITHMCILGRLTEELCEILPNLTALRLSAVTNISEGISRLSNLTQLQELDIRGNDFSKSGIPDVVYQLTGLVRLNLSDCRLRSLDDRLSNLTQLQELDIRGNDFSMSGIPDVIYQLTGLVRLNLSHCRLHSLDDRLDQLQQLEELDISSGFLSSGNNTFIKLPAVVTRLKNLRILDLSRLEALRKLHPDLVRLPRLEKVDCGYCFSLQSPPYSVCQQGLPAIIKYYTDLSDREGIEIPIISAAVIGNRMAGKTSLVWSLRDGRRVLTTRGNTAEEDDTTKVFEVTEISVNGLALKMYDLGGDQIYHISYQLTIRSNYIPIMVVNIEEYVFLSQTVSSEEAARQLCLDYLAHLYLSCPRLGPPILVLTHKDRLTDERFDSMRSELLQAIESLRTKMLDEERKFCRKSSRLSEITHFRSEFLFHPDEIFHFSNDSCDDGSIRALIDHLAMRCQVHIVKIPFAWERMGVYIESRHDVPFIPIADIKAEFPEDDSLVILRSKHDEGALLWFEREEALKEFVFHRISEITEVIALLFHHRTHDLWRQRILDFEPILFNNKPIEQGKYKSLVETFLSSGVLDEAVLFNLYDSLEFPRDVAISLLRAFYLVYGPIQTTPRSTYIIPYLSPDVILITPAAEGLVRLSLGLLFIGLSPASIVYNLLVIAYLDLFTDPGYTVRAASNGAVIHHGETVSWLIHDHTSRQVSLLLDTPVSHLDSSWSTVFQILETILRRLKALWVGARYVCKVYCSHCIYQGETEVICDEDPDWYTPPEDLQTDPPLSARLIQFRGVEPVACHNDGSNGGRLSVPKPLRYPCMNLTDKEKATVQSYLSRLTVSPNIQTAALQGCVTERIEGIVRIMKSSDVHIDMEPVLIPDARILSTQPQFEVTETRGRVLIITNKSDSAGSRPRPGSGADHDNLVSMFSKLGFVTSAEYKNFTAKELVRAIHRETQLVDETTLHSIHAPLGMFILIISSHGSEGTVIGSDNVHVKLTDIYKLLSSRNFPAMKGKPKLVFIQACSGEDVDRMLTDYSTSSDQSHVTSDNDLAEEFVTREITTNSAQSDDNSDNLVPANFFIFKSGFDSYISRRDKVLGTPFIRALVITILTYSHQCHMEALADMVRESVMQFTVQRTDELLAAGRRGEDAYVGQRCTFTKGRRLYLLPGVNMISCDHLLSLPPPVYPMGATQTNIRWLPELEGSDERRSMEQLIHEKEKTTQLKEQITQLHELICEMRTELVQSRPYSNDLHESENIVKEQRHGITRELSQHTQLQRITQLQGITDEMSETVNGRNSSLGSVIERNKQKDEMVDRIDNKSEALGLQLHNLADPATRGVGDVLLAADSGEGFAKEYDPDHDAYDDDDDDGPGPAALEYDPNNKKHIRWTLTKSRDLKARSDSDNVASSGSWQSLSAKSDVTSIPEELSKLLNGFHDTTHKLLRDSSDDSSSFLTCMIVSHHPPEMGPYHLLVISEGYKDMVSSYISNHNDNVLKVSTSHMSSASLRKRYEHHFKVFPHALISILPNKPMEVETLQTESLLRADDDKVKYRHCGIGVEFLKHDCSVKLSVYSEFEDVLDSVKCPYKDMRADNQFAHIVQSLNTLEDFGSSEVVTVVLMAVEENNGEFRSLYKFVAGDIKDDPEDFGKNWILCKVKFTNNKLHQKIKQLCQQNFLSKLDSKLADKWEKESPLFVVTTAAPIPARDGLYEFETIEADLPVSCSERKTFVYKHPSNNRIFFRVFEPASPADVHGIPGDDSTHPFTMAPAGTGRSEQESQQRTLTTKAKLICQQEAVITSFRQNHDVRGKPPHAMTAVISTAMNPDGNISTSIIVVRGIIRGKNQMENINESEKVPFILSFAWIYDESLKGRVEEIWSTFVKDEEKKCWPPYAMVIDYKNWEELKGPKAPKKSQQPQRQWQQQGRIGFKSSSIKFESDGKDSFLIGITEGSQKRYNLMDTVETHQESLLPDGDLQRTWNENLEEITGTAESMISGPGRITSDHCNLTVTAVETRYTLLPVPRTQSANSKPDRLSIEKFIVFVVAIGSSPNDIGTPSEFTYHDVLNLLKCQTWQFNNQPVLANLIETYWKEKTTVDAQGNPCILDVITSTGQPCKKAKHIIIPWPTNTDCNTSFAKLNNVRLKPKAKVPLEIRSHEANLDSLKWHIADLKDYENVRGKLEQAPDKSQPITSEMLPERLRPTSFKYPVIKISTPGLCSLPNCVGTALPGPQPAGVRAPDVQCYYQQNQDETHMKFARPGTFPNTPTIKTVFENLPRENIEPATKD